MPAILNTPITVLGAGSWGTALALVLARNGNETRLWDHNPEHVAKLASERENALYLPGYSFPESLKPFDDLTQSLQGVRDVLLVVPSFAFRDVLQQIKPLLQKDARIAWGTKGLDPETNKLMSQLVIEQLSEATPIAVIAGPSFAAEVAAQIPTAVSIAANNQAFMQDLIERFHNDRFRVYENKDLIGVQLCGVTKNILAIAVGIADGLALGANTRAALITRGLAETARLNAALGGQSKTLLSLAGVGDLVLTATDNQSRNRRFGYAMGQGANVEEALAQVGQVVEGLQNTKHVYELARELKVEMPICEQAYRVLYQGSKPLNVISELLERAPKIES